MTATPSPPPDDESGWNGDHLLCCLFSLIAFLMFIFGIILIDDFINHP
jgi:hypothetical protein